MAIESVEAVRKAELMAAQMEKDALAEKERIISEAKQNAKALIAAMVKEASAKAEDELEKAKRHSEEIKEAARVDAEKEVLHLKDTVRSKEQAAIDLVLSNVI